MDPISGVSSDYQVRVQKLVQDMAKREGEAAIELIDQATPPPAGLEGQGTLINCYG